MMREAHLPLLPGRGDSVVGGIENAGLRWPGGASKDGCFVLCCELGNESWTASRDVGEE